MELLPMRNWMMALNLVSSDFTLSIDFAGFFGFFARNFSIVSKAQKIN
jgi:hypothetical protein